ncbi:hypothetical protein AQUCO_02000596v1 [Aquilegia coerulea]|uniref:Pectinesterase n=1 Tax=Aquilegia coerulea TaxID=218851 RepID=A0A2G5DIB6_AQUCA|nr:hypothetical protein AQUCO_02000596v1 [Aquilegia coerulea]
MDSVKSFKGYGKVDEVEERAFQQKTRRRIIIISVSAIVLVTVIIGAVVGTLIHKNNNNTPSQSPTRSTQPASISSIKAVCSVTQYPESCFSSLSSSLKDSNIKNAADPEQLFKLSMQIALNELSKLSSIPDKLIPNINEDPLVKATLQNCKVLFEDSIDELNSSISSMEVVPGQNLLTSIKIEDIKTWVSTAITNQETCLDGLDETKKSELLSQMKIAMKNSTEFSSNSLAIVSKIMTVLDDLNLPPIHRRKLLGRGGGGDTDTDTDDFQFPKWVHPGDRIRRLLQDTETGTNNLITPDLTVAKDGTGNYRSISEAVAAVGKKNKTRTVIYVKQGKYAENVLVDKAHWNIMMYGDGMTKTIVSGNLNFIDGTPTFSTATFIAAGKGFIAKDMGFENIAGPDKHQAVAFRSGSDQSVFYRCAFDAYQDTLYAHSNRQFYRDCQITGTIDFIFGNAAVVFQNCKIQPRQPMPNQFVTITAQGKKDPNQNTGISIQRSTITPLGNVTSKTYLGRPWKDFSTTIIMESEIGAVVDPSGWFPWVSNVEPPSTIFYAEYKNTGPGSNVDKRVKWAGYKSTIPEDKAAQFTVESFIQGSQWLPETSVTFDSSL